MSDTLKMNMAYGGLMSYEDNTDEAEGDGERINVQENSERENREDSESEKDDSEHEEDPEGKDIQSEGEDQILGEGAEDARFEELLSEPLHEIISVGVNQVIVHENEAESESDDERPISADEYPDSPVETDDEWDNWNKKDERRKRKKTSDPYQYDKPPYLWVMQTFNSGDEFKEQLLRYVLKTQYDVKLNRWENTKQAAVCTHKNCPWKIYCAIEKPIRKWMVKVYNGKHNHLPTGKARMLKQNTIAKLFREEARRRPNIRSSDIKDELMHMYNISVSIFKCRKARRLALDMVLETQKQQFAKLWDYEKELLRSNKGTKVEIGTVMKDEKQVFDRFYVCFEPLRNTWKRCCRPIIGLDSAFLKWELKGEILSAVGRDADNRIYPIAWAVVRGENNKTWEWFVQKLKSDLGLESGDHFTIISDKQKGLLNAVAKVLPNAEHRICARHVYANWKKIYTDLDYKPYFWNVAYNYSVGEYNVHMEKLRLFDDKAHDALLRAEPKTWSRAFFSNNAKCADVTNNLSESFNRTIKGARELPMINMLEAIRRQAMKRISRRFQNAKNWSMQFSPKIAERIEENRENSKKCVIITSSDNLYEVVLFGCSYEVSLRLCHCVCQMWDLSGVPCNHAIRVINDINRDPNNYVDDYYKTATWIDTYKDNIRPVNGEIYWEKTGKEPIGVPGFRKMPGRPKKERVKAAHESPTKPGKSSRGGRIVTCSNCGQTGHNCGTCKNPRKVMEGPKRGRGRPRKAPVDGNTRPPKKRKQTQSQSSIPTSIDNVTCLTYSSAPEPSALQSTNGRGRGRGCGRGRPSGPAKKAVRKETIPRGFGCYISPFTNRIFDVRGNKAVELGGSNQRPSAHPSSQGLP